MLPAFQLTVTVITKYAPLQYHGTFTNLNLTFTACSIKRTKWHVGGFTDGNNLVYAVH